MKRKIYNRLLEWKQERSIKEALHSADYAEKDGIVYLPLYMTPFL